MKNAPGERLTAVDPEGRNRVRPGGSSPSRGIPYEEELSRKKYPLKETIRGGAKRKRGGEAKHRRRSGGLPLLKRERAGKENPGIKTDWRNGEDKNGKKEPGKKDQAVNDASGLIGAEIPRLQEGTAALLKKGRTGGKWENNLRGT